MSIKRARNNDFDIPKPTRAYLSSSSDSLSIEDFLTPFEDCISSQIVDDDDTQVGLKPLEPGSVCVDYENTDLLHHLKGTTEFERCGLDSPNYVSGFASRMFENFPAVPCSRCNELAHCPFCLFTILKYGMCRVCHHNIEPFDEDDDNIITEQGILIKYETGVCPGVNIQQPLLTMSSTQCTQEEIRCGKDEIIRGCSCCRLLLCTHCFEVAWTAVLSIMSTGITVSPSFVIIKEPMDHSLLEELEVMTGYHLRGSIHKQTLRINLLRLKYLKSLVQYIQSQNPSYKPEV
jgi:hypothetical protein